MSNAAPRSTLDGRKRGKGRPARGGNDVGRERLLIATEQLLRTMPPARAAWRGSRKPRMQIPR